MKEIPKLKEKTYLLEEFGGIDKRTTYSDACGSFDIVNFEIEHDGSLRKRCGFRRLMQLPFAISAIWTGNIGGKFSGYVLADKRVYSIDPDSASFSLIGSIPDEYTQADFFCYRGVVYLINGSGIYRVSDGSLARPHGYVPLVGKDWAPLVIGEINEPRNMLNNRGRITYFMGDDPSSFLKTDSPISSVDALYVNGVKRPADTYEISAIPRTVSVRDLNAGDRVEMIFTYAEALPGLDEVFANTRAIVFGGINNTRPFLWGGNNKSSMFSSAYVSDRALRESLERFPESDALYFPAGYDFTVGDGRCPITAVSRHYDRLLIFTQEGAWAANSSSCGIEDFPTMSINSSYGAASPGGAALLGNQPCTISAHSIMRWTSDTEELDECNAYSISGPIANMLDDAFFKSAKVFADKKHDRLIFCSPALSGVMLVYYPQRNAWVRFLTIDADAFFDAGSNVGFIKGRNLYVFDESCVRDEGSVAIVGAFEGNSLDFGSTEHKRLSEATVEATCGSLTLKATLDGKPFEELFSFNTGGEHVKLTKRINARRFKSARFMLRAIGDVKQKIHSLCVTVN